MFSRFSDFGETSDKVEAISSILKRIPLKSNQYSSTPKQREAEDTNGIFVPIFKEIVELYQGWTLHVPITGELVFTWGNAKLLKGTADASVGVESGIDNSYVEFEFKSGLTIPYVPTPAPIFSLFFESCSA